MPGSFLLFAISTINNESDAFCASGLVMGFLLLEAGSGKQDFRVVVENRGLFCMRRRDR